MAQRAGRIPRRTSEIELWDVNPVGTRDAWRRELLQFWSLLATRGRRVKPRAALGKVDELTGKGRPLSVDEVAGLLADRVMHAEGGFVANALHDELKTWLSATVIVPGERRKRRGSLPSAGLATPNYAALLLFNRGVTRERFWAAFLWNALASDFAAGEATGRPDLVSSLLDNYLALGLIPAQDNSSRTMWSGLDFSTIASADPETYLVLRGLGADGADGIGNAAAGLGEDYVRG